VAERSNNTLQSWEPGRHEDLCKSLQLVLFCCNWSSGFRGGIVVRIFTDRFLSKVEHWFQYWGKFGGIYPCHRICVIVFKKRTGWYLTLWSNGCISIFNKFWKFYRRVLVGGHRGDRAGFKRAFSTDTSFWRRVSLIRLFSVQGQSYIPYFFKAILFWYIIYLQSLPEVFRQ
jgi:hypothetical protein